MIYFIVDINKYKGDISLINGDDITILNPIEGINSFLSYTGEIEAIGYDNETTGLDAYVSKVVLWGFGTEEHQYIFHHTIDLKEVFLAIQRKFLLGHNIKFDIKFTKVVYGILLTNLYDTMITEQRLYQKSGISNSLDSLVRRYLDKIMIKEVREEFIGCDPITFQLYNRHIRYAAKDISVLFPIKVKQEITIKKYKMEFLLYGIEFPLISIIAKAELTGFRLDVEKWKGLYKKNVKRRFELECNLDKEIRRLRDSKPKHIRQRLVGGMYDHNRIEDTSGIFNYDDKTTNVLDLFGNPMSLQTLTGKKKPVKRSPNNVNYNSHDQIVDIFAKLEEDLLTEYDTIAVPHINKKERKQGFQANSDAFEAYLKMKPNCETKVLIEYLIEYGSVLVKITTFGLSFLNKINPVTGRIHTIYRQATAATSRFQSGGGKKESDKPNFQNIPAIKAYRNCFMVIDPTHDLTTADFSGAELMIMVSLSKDLNLLKLASKDMHSYMNQAIWRNIYRYRYHQLVKITDKLNTIPKDIQKKLDEYSDLSTNFIVSKKINKEFRNKNLTFGSIYGMYPAKAGKILNVIKQEGAIAINTIKKIIPKIFQVVEAASNFAKTHGYIIINSRTNSRAWFPEHIKLIRGEINEDDNFKILSKEQSEARNIKIQGTQADFVKEATVVLQQYIDHYNLTDLVTIVHWVHDELVTDHPKYLDGKSDEWKEWIDNNPKGLSIIHKGEFIEGLSFPKIKKLVMNTVADRYLKNVKMKTEYETLPYWTK